MKKGTKDMMREGMMREGVKEMTRLYMYSGNQNTKSYLTEAQKSKLQGTALAETPCVLTEAQKSKKKCWCAFAGLVANHYEKLTSQVSGAQRNQHDALDHSA